MWTAAVSIDPEINYSLIVSECKIIDASNPFKELIVFNKHVIFKYSLNFWNYLTAIFSQLCVPLIAFHISNSFFSP